MPSVIDSPPLSSTPSVQPDRPIVRRLHSRLHTRGTPRAEGLAGPARRVELREPVGLGGSLASCGGGGVDRGGDGGRLGVGRNGLCRSLELYHGSYCGIEEV